MSSIRASAAANEAVAEIKDDLYSEIYLSEATIEKVARRTRLEWRNFKHSTYAFIKRSFDICCGLAGCVALLPIMIGVKIANLLTGDTAPILLKQERLAKGGGTFTLYKIRSMVTGKNGSLEAQNLLEDLFKEHPELEEEYRISKKLKDDPRITKVGNFIRKTSLDEFPQFINVLRGDMSMIGNRPYLPCEKADISKRDLDRILSTRPGITGRWQVSGRSNLDFRSRIKLDAGYSETANLKSDIHIFLLTIKNVIKKDGAK